MTAFEKYQKAIRRMKLGTRESEICWVDSRMNSTDLMTRLILNSLPDYDPEKYADPIDVLFARLFSRRYHEGIELAIIRLIPEEADALFPEDASIDENKMTFTEFKKNKVFFWLDIDEERRSCEIPIDQHCILNLWDKPFFLQASTAFDKDFRKEWHGDSYVREGNNFGDTSRFYIIGSIKRVRPKSSTK